VPPRWAFRDWCDEAHAQGALAACLAERDFDPSRGIALEAFLYRRILDSVWTRHRQECRFGRRAGRADVVDHEPLALWQTEPELLEEMTRALERLTEPERRLIRQLFWEGYSVRELARVLGVSQDLLRKRKNRALHKIRESFARCL
jgi:RNA polymerase sigma factor (sigma-70 family)